MSSEPPDGEDSESAFDVCEQNSNTNYLVIPFSANLGVGGRCGKYMPTVLVRIATLGVGDAVGYICKQF
jgi:hypothetical protein